MSSEETELTGNERPKNDQKSVFVIDTHTTFPEKMTNDNDDTSLRDSSSDSSHKDGTLHALSGLYAQIVVVIAAIMVFTELLHGPLPLFFFHGYLYTYLVGGGIICFIGAYMSMLFRKCPRWSKSNYEGSRQSMFSTQFMKNLLFSDINVYLRIGSTLFGLGTIISSGLEVAAIFTASESCMDEINMLQPILRALFSFIQMHFLFMNAKELLNAFRWFRHIALMHLVATNLAIWIRIMLWESAYDWLEAEHLKFNSSIKFGERKVLQNYVVHMLESDVNSLDQTKHTPNHTIGVVRQCVFLEDYEISSMDNETESLMAYHLCIRNSTIGDIWTKAMPYLYPFIVQYSLVATAVIYITWSSLQTQRLKLQRFAAVSVYGRNTAHDDMSCSGSTKGLFSGLLMLVAGIITIILFFVLAKEKNFNVHSMIGALECGIFGLSTLVTIIGIIQIRKMERKTSRESRLNDLIQRIGMLAVYFYGICNIIVGGTSLTSSENVLLFIDGILMVIQACLQSLFIHQVSKKRLGPTNIDEKPGRDAVMFLVFSNIVLWMLETFTTQKQVRSQLQLQFYGEVAWPVITRIVLPFVMFYRFHSAVALMEAWRKSYRVKQN